MKHFNDRGHTEVLSQEEIDQLLTAINAGDTEPEDFRPITSQSKTDWDIESFEDYLINREFPKEDAYGIFDKDVTICCFFNDKNENLLEDIRKKNDEQGQGNVKIPNTDITLINYSFCSKCNTVYSFKDITDYYKNPKPDPLFNNKAHQYRTDTRVYCHNCGTYFLPSLIISDKSPRNEMQFLCRSQTIDAVEKYFSKKNKKVLTQKSDNIVLYKGLKAIKNDVPIKQLSEKPTLVTNMIQYTPFNLIMNLIDGSNIKKGDCLFGEWN